MEKQRGLGDTVAAITNFVGIKKTEECNCKKRQEWLNEKFPYNKK
tara:strand:- start:112 stop:246 length:135 start_codon:yes stop_codon:yes gene_type:complete